MEFYGDKIRLNFSLEKTEVDYFYKIFFNYTLNKESKTFETEQIQSKEEGSSIQFNAYLIIDYFFYKYQKLEITVQKLKKNRGLRNFEIWENRISLSTIISSKNCIFKTPISLNNQENIIIHVEKEKGNNNVNISLFDYIKSGILFKSFIAIDFSDNEYHILSDQKNQYLLAIKGFRKILYDFSRLYEVYGFGNNLNINKKEQFFNLSKDENFCEIEGYTNIFLAYIEILNQIKFEDNILLKEKKLSPLIKYLITKIMNQQNPNYYNIIFLLINSLSPNDYQDCVDVFIRASFLPLSFVIIGIGENDNNFNIIKKLCDESVDKKGKKRIRKNTYFISMKDFKQNFNLIQDECLKKIPEQLCEFYYINKVDLNQIIERNQNNNKNSLKVFDTYNSLIQQINLEEKVKNKVSPSKIKPIIYKQNKDKKEIIINNNINKENNCELNIGNNMDKNRHKNKVKKIEINLNIKNKNRKNLYQKYKSEGVKNNIITKKEIDFNLHKKGNVNKKKEQKEQKEEKNLKFKTESNKSTDVGERKYKLQTIDS